jgi:DNA primase
LIPQETVGLIRGRVDIVEVIGAVVELRRAGGNFKGLCPFHAEKTPSFNVSAARQMYHCFGCGEGGDVIAFIMNYEGRTFAEAVRELGQRVGVPVEEEKFSPGKQKALRRQRSQQERLTRAMELAVGFYAEQLTRPEGAAARAYLKERELSEETIARFGLGYAPADWDRLYQRLLQQGVAATEAERAGLVAARRQGGGYYDRLRERVVFPVHDAGGRVVALAGRVLPGASAEAPKYVNSPETALFSKSRVLYGLHQARTAFRQRKAPLVVEGYLDVISLHQHGFETAVAPMGTALTQDQVGLLRRYAGPDAVVTLLFDGDEAGRRAATRSQPLLAEGGLGARIALLPEGEDPDSAVRGWGQEKLDHFLSQAEGIVDYLIKAAAQSAETDSRSQVRALRSLWPALSTVKDPMERDLYRRRVAQVFGIEEDLVFRYLRGAPEAPTPPAAKRATNPRHKAEGTVTGALLDFPNLFEEARAGGLLNHVYDPTLRWVLDQLGQVAAGQATLEQLADQAPNEKIAQRVRARLVAPQFSDEEEARRALAEGLDRLRQLGERERALELQQQVKSAEAQGDADRALRLAQEKLQRKRAVQDDPGGTPKR